MFYCPASQWLFRRFAWMQSLDIFLQNCKNPFLILTKKTYLKPNISKKETPTGFITHRPRAESIRKAITQRKT